MGTEKVLYSSFKVQLHFTIQGLAVIVKKISPFTALPLIGKFFFTLPAKPFLVKYNCTFHDSKRIFISRPHFLRWWDWPISPLVIFLSIDFDITWQLNYIFLPRFFISGLLGNGHFLVDLNKFNTFFDEDEVYSFPTPFKNAWKNN